jgi:hypothetical protein
MTTLSQVILFIVPRRVGISSRELVEAIYGRSEQQLVNNECNFLADRGLLIRRKGADGIYRHYPISGAVPLAA